MNSNMAIAYYLIICINSLKGYTSKLQGKTFAFSNDDDDGDDRDDVDGMDDDCFFSES